MFVDLKDNNPKITNEARTISARYQKGMSSGDFSACNSGIINLGNYTPNGICAGKCVDVKGISPTVMENHGMGTAVIVNKEIPDLQLEPNDNAKTTSQNYRIRKLTPRECWRLQGFPDEYFDKAKYFTARQTIEILKAKGKRSISLINKIINAHNGPLLERVSDSQLYKQAGNGVTVNVARAIGEKLLQIEKGEKINESFNG